MKEVGQFGSYDQTCGNKLRQCGQACYTLDNGAYYQVEWRRKYFAYLPHIAHDKAESLCPEMMD